MKDMASNRFEQWSLFGGRCSQTLAFLSLVICCSFIPSVSVRASDDTWTNTTGGNYEDISNWNTGAIPTAANRAIFANTGTTAGNFVVMINSNEVVGDVLANTASAASGLIWYGTNITWTVNNTFFLDQTGGASNIIRSATVTVTNAAGTGLFSVGNYASGNPGVFRFERTNTTTEPPPQLIADGFRMTSNSTVIDVRAGTITTGSGGTIIDRPAGSTLALENGADTLTWNMTGGSNSINYISSGTNFNSGTIEFAFANTGTMNINVSGNNTTWFLGGIETELGWNGACHLNISGGAKVTNAAPVVVLTKNGAGESNSTIVVTGAGSQWNLAGELRVGSAVRNNSMTISAGGVVNGTIGQLGINVGSSNNTVTVTDPNSLWNLTAYLQLGSSGPRNSLIITNGGKVNSSGNAALGSARLGNNASAVGCTIFVDGIGSVWNCNTNVVVGNSGGSSVVSVKNGAQFDSLGTVLGATLQGTNDLVLVDGTGSLWNANGIVQVGPGGNNNQVTVSNGGELNSGGINISGVSGGGINNSVLVSNGTLIATNSAVGGIISVGSVGDQGTFTLNGGTVTADQLMLTNGTVSAFKFLGGVLNVKTSMVANGSAFVVGNGSSAATLNLQAFSHTFANGLSITANATLSGIGTINGNVTLDTSATLAPGLSGVGTQIVVGALVLNPSTTLDYAFGAPGGPGSLVIVDGNLTLDGTVNVSNLGGMATGSYTLFSYTGSLVNNTLNIGTLPAGVTATVSNDTVNQLVLLNTVVTASDPFTAWQNQYFTSGELLNPAFSGPNADPFGKGMSNTNQFLAGFNPTNATAYVHIVSIAKTNSTDIAIGYLGASGDNTYSGGPATRTNVLEFTAGSSGNYNSNTFSSTGVTNILSGGTGLGTLGTMVDPGGATNVPSRYYRVRVLVP